MYIRRQDLIQICDQFINGDINKSTVTEFAWNCYTSEETDWDDNDQFISLTIFEWDNETINYPISKLNMRLWKNRLINNVDQLKEYNFWNSHIENQKVICSKYNSVWRPVNKKFMLGTSINLNSDPLHGLRHQPAKSTTGWFIWNGEYSEDENFFKPMCAEHLMQIRPEIIKYLGLDIGFRFLIDKNNYEDVWFDKKIEEI